MPRLSLYKPEKGNDYKFIDRQASEMFQVGGTDVYLHKYLGANTQQANASADQPNYASTAVTNIQDLLFLENRDRSYDTEIYRIRGMYNVQNIDFNLSQFGLFIDNDTLYMTVHINNFITYIGRKPISGDVIELPHLRDDFALNDKDFSLPRYYVIEDVGRASEGFSVTWYPHLYRLKLKRVTDSQQFASIFGQAAKDANGDPAGGGTTLKDLLSTYNKEIAINQQLIAQAESDAPKSGYETRQFYTLAVDPTNGEPLLETADEVNIDASSNRNASTENAVAQRSGYTGYLLGDGFPVNGYDFGFGIQFPASPQNNDYFLRSDFLPNRLFRYSSGQNAWVAVEDSLRMNMTNNNSRSTLKTGFINNNNWTYVDPEVSASKNLTAGDSVIYTDIDYHAFHSQPYVVLKIDSIIVDYVQSEYPGLITSFSYTNTLSGATYQAIKITLPIINSIQQTVPYTGQYFIELHSTREAQRQSISKVLKPRADL